MGPWDELEEKSEDLVGASKIKAYPPPNNGAAGMYRTISVIVAMIAEQEELGYQVRAF